MLNIDLENYKFPDLASMSEEFRNTLIAASEIGETLNFPVLLGDYNNLIVEDIFNRPNLLVAGTTGSGKTQFIYNQVAFWLYHKRPAQIKFIFCGSKSIDYNIFTKLDKHYHAAVDKGEGIINPECFLKTANGLLFEIQRRIHLFNFAEVKTIKQYNDLYIKNGLNPNQGHHYLPDIIVLIDDLFHFTYSQDLDNILVAITQQNSHTGIYLIAATSQVNSPNISKQLRSNFTIRIAFRLISQSDSKKILDNIGAEKIVGPGEMIYNFSGQLLKAKQPYVDYEQLKDLVECISGQKGYQDFYMLHNPNPKIEFDPNDRDSMFEDAARIIVMHQQGSTSLIQRKLKLGYNRAGRIIDQLESAGIIGPFDGSKPREVLILDDYALERFLNKMYNSEDKYYDKNNNFSLPDNTAILSNPAILLMNQSIPSELPQKQHSLQGEVVKNKSIWRKIKDLF